MPCWRGTCARITEPYAHAFFDGSWSSRPGTASACRADVDAELVTITSTQLGQLNPAEYSARSHYDTTRVGSITVVLRVHRVTTALAEQPSSEARWELYLAVRVRCSTRRVDGVEVAICRPSGKDPRQCWCPPGRIACCPAATRATARRSSRRRSGLRPGAAQGGFGSSPVRRRMHGNRHCADKYSRPARASAC